MKYLSLFSGIGGFELGIGNKGECIGYSEIDKYAIQIYERRFNHKNYGDITTINAEQLPTFDLLVGGFPCQAFSIAGKRKGFDDTRGTLFFDIARILRAKKPRLLLLENVKGLLSHDKGKTFATIIATLDELGYDLQWQVLNSKNFGVPQNRERVFIIGHLRGTSRPQVFPIGKDDSLATREKEEYATANTLTANYWKGPAQSRPIVQVNNPKHSNDRVYSPEGISPTLNTMQGGNRQPFIADKNIDGKVYTYPYVPPLRTSASNYNMSLHGWGKIRRLTPIECERLQGFPDGWTESVSDTQRYKCLGNAVTVNVIEYIMSKLI